MNERRKSARKIGQMAGGTIHKRTNCCRFNHVADGESFDRLVLRRTSRAVRASDRLNVTSPLFITTATSKTSQYFGPYLEDWNCDLGISYFDARFLTIARTVIGG